MHLICSSLLFALIVLFPVQSHAGKWSDWCSRHLIDDDPYQFEHVSAENLVKLYDYYESDADLQRLFRNEALRRLSSPMSNDNRFILLTILTGEK